MTIKKTPATARLSVRVSPGLKRTLLAQSQEAGVSLAEWIRIRLEFDDATPAGVADLLQAICALGEHARGVFRRVDASQR